MAENRKNIELRSEKVRNIVGKIPPILLRIGISIITFIILALFIAAYLIPYPEKFSFPIELKSIPHCEIITAPESGFISFQDQTDTICEQQKIAIIKSNNDSTIIIKSIRSGQLLNNCNNDSFVNKGDILFAIIPYKIEYIYGLSYISKNEIDKIQSGLSVKIELIDYSIKKYGFLEGQISKIFPIPENGNKYKVEIKLIGGFDSTDESIINYIPFLKGDAVILLSKEPFLKKIFNSIKRKK